MVSNQSDLHNLSVNNAMHSGTVGFFSVGGKYQLLITEIMNLKKSTKFPSFWLKNLKFNECRKYIYIF